MKRVIKSTKYIKSGRAITVDIEGLKNSIRPLCDIAIKESGLPISSFTIGKSSLEKKTRPVRYNFRFTLKLRGDIIPTYKQAQSGDGSVNLDILLYDIPTDVEITPESLYEGNIERVKDYIISHVYTYDAIENYKSIYNDKLKHVTEICDSIGDKYGIDLTPEFYPSIENLDGTPDETITLYIKPTSVEGKLGDLYPSEVHGGYMAYVIDGVEYSSDIDYLCHRFTVDEAHFKPVGYSLNYDKIYSQIETHVQQLLQAIDIVDDKVELHSEAEKALNLQVEKINSQLGLNILTTHKPSIQNLGFFIVCNVGGKEFVDSVDEEEALDPTFWKNYTRKVKRRVRSHYPSLNGDDKNISSSSNMRVSNYDYNPLSNDDDDFDYILESTDLLEEGNVISSAIDLYSEEDDPVEFNSVEDYLKYNIEEGYIDWLSLPSEENDDFDDDDFDDDGFDDDFYDTVYQIESAIAKVTHGGEYKICVPNQFEDENGAFCTVIANGKRYVVEGIGNSWIVSDGFADEEDEHDVDDED